MRIVHEMHVLSCINSVFILITASMHNAQHRSSYRLNTHSLRKEGKINSTERTWIVSQSSYQLERQTKENTPGQTAAQVKSESLWKAESSLTYLVSQIIAVKVPFLKHS